MAIAIVVPRLGWNMDEGVFVGWLKADGDIVRTGEPLFTIEGEKATQDIEATDDGILCVLESGPRGGERVAVGMVVGHLMKAGESAHDVEMPALVASAGGNNVQPVVVPPAPTRERRIASSPLARRMAVELGIDWRTLKGSGKNGRIRRADVLEAAATRRSTPEVLNATGSLRRTIARRMVESLRSTAPVTLMTSADAGNLAAIRGQFRALASGSERIPGYTDMFVKLAAAALSCHPHMQAQWREGGLFEPRGCHIGVAVDTEAGLVVPVVRDADRLGLREVVRGLEELIERARRGRLGAEEMEGGTFTITNLGAYGVETFTPILNPPQSAILGIGRIRSELELVADRPTIRQRIGLSLTFDHRVVDGGPAARFLQELVRYVENPAPCLI